MNNQTNTNGILEQVIGKPEVQVSLKTETVLKFFGILTLSAVVIIIVHALFKKA